MAARYSRILRTVPFIIVIFLVSLPACAKYSGGSGTGADPYQIATAQDLIDLGNEPNDYDMHFILTADIDLDPNLPGGKVFDKAVIAPEHINYNSEAFDGNSFCGCFDGRGHVIHNLNIQGQDYLGLFGYLNSDAQISNLGVEDVNISGRFNIGGLAGESSAGISSSYVTGIINGASIVGGLVGCNNYGCISLCYNTSKVKGEGWHYDVGGLVGFNSGNISSSYSTGNTDGIGIDYVGGLVGENTGIITASYSTGSLSGDNFVGGLVGSNEGGSINASYSSVTISGIYIVGGLVGCNAGCISSSYSTGTVVGDSDVGGLVGMLWIVSGRGFSENSIGVVIDSFWDKDSSGNDTSAGGTGLTTAQMQDPNTFITEGWDSINETTNGTCGFWQFQEGTYPGLAVFSGFIPIEPQGAGIPEEPYLITNIDELLSIWYRPMAHYRLAADIDLSGITRNLAVVPWLDGSFDGNDFCIRSIQISGTSNLGMFGILGYNAEVMNLGLEDVSIEGTGYQIGGLAGLNLGSVSSSYSSGTVTGEQDVGGLVGLNCDGGDISMSRSACTVSGLVDVGGLVGCNNWRCIIATSYSTGMVSGDWWVGGLVGSNAYSNITSSYSTSSVSGNDDIGGLVGSNVGDITMCYSTGAVSGEHVGGLVGDGKWETAVSSFWDVETSGLNGSDGGIGLTTAEMMDPHILGLNGFANDPNWVLNPGLDYPRLAWEGTPGQIIPEPEIYWLEGDGTTEQPYRIIAADQLILLGKANVLCDKFFVLCADIDLDPNLPDGQIFGQAIIPMFAGVFDGNDHVISNLTISGGSYLGLFGKLENGAEIRNLGIFNSNVTGSGSYIGGLAGYNYFGSITKCYSTCLITGNWYVGGLAGINEGDIITCHFTGEVIGNYYVGGLVGGNGSNVAMCYSTGSVSGDQFVGGLAGYDSGSIEMSYSTGTVSGNENVGGLVGKNYSSGIITSCFWDVETSGLLNICGINYGDTTSYDDSFGKTTAEMQTESTFTDVGWDFVGEMANGTDDIWWIDEGNDYPRLWWQKI